jgi:hypothetical protein
MKKGIFLTRIFRHLWETSDRVSPVPYCGEKCGLILFGTEGGSSTGGGLSLKTSSAGGTSRQPPKGAEFGSQGCKPLVIEIPRIPSPRRGRYSTRHGECRPSRAWGGVLGIPGAYVPGYRVSPLSGAPSVAEVSRRKRPEQDTRCDQRAEQHKGLSHNPRTPPSLPEGERGIGIGSMERPLSLVLLRTETPDGH